MSIDGYFLPVQDLQCGICTESFVNNDPRMLPCQHTFCLNCLQGLKDKGKHFSRNSFLCPVCRKSHQWPNSGTKGFPKNLLATSLKATYQSKTTAVSSASERNLENCQRHFQQAINPLTVCKSCRQKNLCLKCLTEHATCSLEPYDKFSQEYDENRKRIQEKVKLYRDNINDELKSLLSQLKTAFNDVTKVVEENKNRLEGEIMKKLGSCKAEADSILSKQENEFSDLKSAEEKIDILLSTKLTFYPSLSLSIGSLRRERDNEQNRKVTTGAGYWSSYSNRFGRNIPFDTRVILNGSPVGSQYSESCTSSETDKMKS
ncbi:unnamed protein product [Dimorphilus gyrociliatus]|uniref:RING-type domain-containing protein n=1 Tax=Dimorphilus gyrociliatus TaxID=2664684 RepID=A0A7I8VBR1_9ANNE|nr:unnamed protein product [Dimorphilus gyrociliatus]